MLSVPTLWLVFVVNFIGAGPDLDLCGAQLSEFRRSAVVDRLGVPRSPRAPRCRCCAASSTRSCRCWPAAPC